MDIVMPLLAADLDRYLRLQRPTFERYYADLGTTWVITPRDDVPTVQAATAHIEDVRVLDELAIAPELAIEQWGPRRADGWYLQQLVKLAAVERSEAPFVLVVDADVVAVRPVSDADLVIGGRALRPIEPVTTHPDWVVDAARVLDVAPIDHGASVTPSVLAPEAVRLLARRVEQVVRIRRRRMRAAALVPGLGRRVRSWRGRLLGALPWTEYQLYDTFLVRSGNFDRFHRVSTEPLLYGNCVWNRDAFESWHAKPSPSAPTYFFSVVQSNTGIGVDAVVTKLIEAGLLD